MSTHSSLRSLASDALLRFYVEIIHGRDFKDTEGIKGSPKVPLTPIFFFR